MGLILINYYHFGHTAFTSQHSSLVRVGRGGGGGGGCVNRWGGGIFDMTINEMKFVMSKILLLILRYHVVKATTHCS